MKKSIGYDLLKGVLVTLAMILFTMASYGQGADIEYLSSPDYKGDVTRIEEHKYYKSNRDDPYKLSDIEVFRYNDGKLMDAYQKINREGNNRIFRKFIYNDKGLLATVEIDTEGNNAVTQKLEFSYDAAGNITRLATHRGRNMSYMTYKHDGNSKLIGISRTNEKGRTYQDESFTYDSKGRILAWESKDRAMKSKSTKNYSYSEENGQLTTTIAIVEFNGATSTEYKTTDPLGNEISFKEKMGNSLEYESTSQYIIDSKTNWTRMDRMRSNHRFSYTLRQITYADGTITGHLLPAPEDAYMEWSRVNKNLFYVWVDGKDIRQTVKSSYLFNSPDVLGHDPVSGRSFIMKNFRNDTTNTWRPVQAPRMDVDLYWIANDDALYVYHKGNSNGKREALIVNEDVIVYMYDAHQSFLLKNYNANKDGQLHAAQTLSPATNAFWYKTENNSFRLIINGAYAKGVLPNKWLNSTDLVVDDDAGEPRYALKGYSTAKTGKLYPATPYN